MSLSKRIADLRSKLADLASGLSLIERRVAHFEKRAKNAGDFRHPHPVVLDRATKRLHYWREKERKAYLRRHHFKVALKRATKKLAKQGPRVSKVNGKQRVVGGTLTERLVFAAEWARKHWSDYYSEEGAYDEDFALNNHEHTGKRRDCSWWWYEIHRVCGIVMSLVEPRFTGSILREGREVSRHYAETHVGVAVVYGSGEGFHVGFSTGHGPYTFEHGTPTLNTGSFDEFGPGTEVRYRAVAS